MAQEAEAVCIGGAGTGLALLEVNVRDGIMSLCEKSLLQRLENPADDALGPKGLTAALGQQRVADLLGREDLIGVDWAGDSRFGFLPVYTLFLLLSRKICRELR